MVDTWTVLDSMAQWQQLQQQFVVYQALSIVVLPLIIVALLILFKGAWPFVWARLITHECVVCHMDRMTRTIKPDKRFRKRNGVLYFLAVDPKDPKRRKRYIPQPFVKMYPGNFLFTGFPWDIVDADISVLEDLRFQRACNQLKSEGYPNIESLERAILFSSMIPQDTTDTTKFDPRLKEWMDREGYTDYESMRKKINPKNYTIESDIVKKFFVFCPITEFLGYCTDIPESNINGECHDIYESKKPQEEAKRKLQDIFPIAVVIILICAAGAIAVVWLKI